MEENNYITKQKSESMTTSVKSEYRAGWYITVMMFWKL